MEDKTPDAPGADNSAEDTPQVSATDRRRRTFGPVLLLGLAAAGLAAVAASKAWMTGSSGEVSTDNPVFLPPTELAAAQESPLSSALALVLLACWGVLLVTRGKARRAVAGLAVVSALGLFVVTVMAPGQMAEDLVALLTQASGLDTAEHDLTAWYLAALAASVVSVPAALAAFVLVPSWPEMGNRYDAPTAGAVSEEPRTNLELWKALDEGQDPTA